MIYRDNIISQQSISDVISNTKEWVHSSTRNKLIRTKQNPTKTAIWPHCDGTKSLENVTLHNRSNNGHVQDDDIYQLYNHSDEYFQYNH